MSSSNANPIVFTTYEVMKGLKGLGSSAPRFEQWQQLVDKNTNTSTLTKLASNNPNVKKHEHPKPSAEGEPSTKKLKSDKEKKSYAQLPAPSMNTLDTKASNVLPIPTLGASIAKNFEPSPEDKLFFKAVAKILTDKAQLSDDIYLKNPNFRKQITKFDSKETSPISLENYLARFLSLDISPEAWVLGLVCIDDILKKFNIFFDSHNMHRFVLAALRVASKAFDDRYYSNGSFAFAGGVEITELNELEVQFLSGLDWNVPLITGKDKIALFSRDIIQTMFLLDPTLSIPERTEPTPAPQEVSSTSHKTPSPIMGSSSTY